MDWFCWRRVGNGKRNTHCWGLRFRVQCRFQVGMDGGKI